MIVLILGLLDLLLNARRCNLAFSVVTAFQCNACRVKRSM